MWQLQNMDPEEMEAMGINVEGDNKEPTPSEEEQQQQPPAPQNDTAAQAQEAPSSSAQPIESSTGPQISDEEKIELFTVSIGHVILILIMGLFVCLYASYSKC